MLSGANLIFRSYDGLLSFTRLLHTLQPNVNPLVIAAVILMEGGIEFDLKALDILEDMTANENAQENPEKK